MTVEIVEQLDQLIESESTLEDAYQQWLNIQGPVKLAQLSLEEWEEVADKLGHDDDWAQERFESWSDNEEEGDDW